MGLSASQARLLTLTARQSNLEYEGQQINQQRTTLSNASSNYYNSLLEMKVPVPPSTNDYTKVVYTFTIGGNTATVKEALPKTDEKGNTTYYISYTTELSTIGVAENDAYKTGAHAKKVPADIREDIPWDDYLDDENQGYYLAAMNTVNSNEEALKLNNEGTKLYMLQDGYSSETTKYIMGPDGYQMTVEAYNKLKAEVKPHYFIETEEGDNKGKVYHIIKDENDEDKKVYDNNILAKDIVNINKKSAEAQSKLDKVRFFREYDKNNDKDQINTKYALSYAKLPNEIAYNSHKDTDKIYHIKEVSNSENSTNSTDGYYTYRSSYGDIFTVVDSEYVEAFLNAGLNADDYYQYAIKSDEKVTYRFVKRQDVEGNLNSDTRSISTSSVTTIKVKKENTISNAKIEFDHTGRISTITDDEGYSHPVSATTEKDEDAYEDAYNQYEYEQYIYDQRQSEINANIKVLQAQDKSLELRLSNLDTQHSAIQTEMEAVKKVVNKNIETSFKTFNA